jgi:Lipocalin-like domain
MTRDDLVGTWRFVEFRLIDASDGRVTRPWGENHAGQIMYAADGFMSVLMRNPRGMLGYCGPYTIEGEDVVHHIALATDPKLVGTVQRRRVAIEGRRVTLTSEDSLYGGAGTHANLVWERAT